MAKTLNEWLDEFVDNGADSNNVVDWPENAGGGVVVVSELPEVGQEDTIYALEEQEIIPASYNWAVVPVDSAAFPNNTDPIMVTDSRDTLDIDLVKAKLSADAAYVVVYYRETDDVDCIKWGETEGTLSIVASERQTEEGLMTGFFTGDFIPFCVVTEYNEDVNLEARTVTQTVKFPNGSIKTYITPGDIEYNPDTFVQLIDATEKLETSSDNKIWRIYEVTELPTAKEVITNHYNSMDGDPKRNFLILNNGEYKETFYATESKILGYFFNREKQNFYTDDAEPVLYEGELEWIPQESVEMTNVLYFTTSRDAPFIFTPTPGGVIIKTTKYVYENGKYINISEPSISTNRFIKFNEDLSENLYYGDKITGCKVQVDFANYYDLLIAQGKTIISYDAAPSGYNYRQQQLIDLGGTGESSGDIDIHDFDYYPFNYTVGVFLKYDYEGNVWAHFYYKDDEHEYYEISTAIQVATAEDMQHPDFVFPIVEFEIPENIEVLNNKIIVSIDIYTKPILGYGFTSTSLVKIYKD